MLRKFVLTAAAAGAIGFAAFTPVQAGALHSTTGLITTPDATVQQVQHWRWGSRNRHWRWGSSQRHWRWRSRRWR